jgi:hypothetical protein
MSNKQTPIEKAIDLIDGFLTELDDIAENNKQQTAVEWLYNELTKTWYDAKSSKQLFDKAKEMEKERLEKTWIEALDYGINNLKGLNNLSSKEAFDKWYNETYGGGEK